jgi:hypothetical protein
MNFTFNCLFAGLCGFVFNKPFASSPDRARVLLPQGDEASIPEGLNVHRSMLLIPSKNLKGTGGYNPSFVVQPKGKELTSVYLLSGFELEFDFHGEGTPQGFQVEASPITDAEAPIGNERVSFFTVGRLEKGAPGVSTLSSDCLTDPPKRERVDARVRINNGKLFVRSLTQFKDDTGKLKDDIWDFKVSGGLGLPTFFSQVLAEDVIIEKKEISSKVTLIGTKLDAERTPAFKLEVGPYDDAQTVVEIEVVCGEVEGLFDLQSSGYDPNLAADIKLLYRLSKNWKGEVYEPLGVVPIPRRRKGGTGLSIHCPRALFVDDPNA